jgi:uncharacterized protein with HXXEE motif
MIREPTNTMVSTRLTAILLWVFPLTYLIHIAEEYWGGEGYPAYILRLRGVHLSTTRFLAAQSVGFVLVTIGVLLARKLHFPQMMLIVMGTIVLVNGLTHTVTALTSRTYGPGLVSSILIWMPLGLFILIRYRQAVSRKRYWLAIAVGVSVNVIIGIFTMRGGRIVR